MGRNMEPAFDFLNYQIAELSYCFDNSDRDLKKEHSIESEIRLERGNEDPSAFRITMIIRVLGNPNIRLTIYGYFKWRGEYIEKTTELSLNIYGTSILYPYARAAISTISVLDGKPAIMLPTINAFDIFQPKDKGDKIQTAIDDKT